MTQEDGKYDRLEGPPFPLFFNSKERDFVKQIVDELTERVIGQAVVYYSISMDQTNFHPLYGEAIVKTFYPPLKVNCLVEWTDNPTTVTNYGSDNTTDILIHFHKRRLAEDQNLYVRVGDFVAYDDQFFEILSTFDPKLLFGQGDQRFEISAKASKARDGQFNAN